MKIKLLLPALLLLASCAPRVTGGDEFNPQVMPTALSSVKMQPGQVKYVEFAYPRSAIKVDEKYFKDLNIDFSNRFGEGVQTPRVPAGWLTMKATNLPAGLDVSLVKAQLAKDIVKTDNDPNMTTVHYYERIYITMKVSTSPSLPLGRHVVPVEFSDGATTSPLMVTVEVAR